MPCPLPPPWDEAEKKHTHSPALSVFLLESAECFGGWSGRFPEVVIREASGASGGAGVQFAVVKTKQAASAETEGLLT